MNTSFETFSSFDPWAPAPDEIQEEVDDFSVEDLQLLQKTGFTTPFIQEVLRNKFQINTFDYFLFMSTVITHQGLAGQLGPQQYYANMAQCRRFTCFGALQKLTVAGVTLEVTGSNFDVWYPHVRVLGYYQQTRASGIHGQVTCTILTSAKPTGTIAGSSFPI